MFNNLTLPVGLTLDYMTDVIFTRYEFRRPAYSTPDVIDTHEQKRFISDWNNTLKYKSKVFADAYNQLTQTPEFIEFMENLSTDTIAEGETINTGTNTVNGTGTNTTTNNLSTLNSDLQNTNSSSFAVNEVYPVVAGYYPIDGPIENPATRDITKSDGTNTGNSTTTNTGTVGINSVSENETTLNTKIANTNNTDTTSVKKGFNRPVWELVESYIKNNDPWEILWDALDPLFSTYYKVEV